MSTNNATISQKPRHAVSASKPKGILVLGMHRSGTSAFIRVLNLLGCALPDRLIGPGVGNEAGHWESADAVYLNAKMLASAGSNWEDWGPINEDWRNSAIRTEMIGQALSIVQEHGQLGPLFAMKDPRMCRLADVWLEAMDAANVDPHVIVMLRNPAEVAASLENRDLMAPGYGQLLWLRHVLDAEFLSRGQCRVFSRYDQLMSNWQGVMAKVKTELGIALPRNSQSVHAEIDQFLSADRRHYDLKAESVIANPGLSDWLRRTFAIMLTWSEQGEDNKDYRELDAVREEFDRAYDAFARLLLPGEAAGRLGSGGALKQELEAKLAEAQQATDAARNAVSEAESLRTSSVVQEVELRKKIAELEGALPELRAETQKEQGRRLEAEQLLASARAELEAQHAAEGKLADRLATLESTLAQREEEVAQLWTKIGEAASASKKAEEREEQVRLQRIGAEQRIQQLERIVGEQQAEMDTLATRLQRQEKTTREVQKERDLIEERLAERFQEIAQLTNILEDENLSAHNLSDKLRWLQRLLNERQNFPRWWAILPSDWRCKREGARMQQRGLFSSEKYLEIYPDVAKEGMDPLRHYITHGINEGRQCPE